MDSNEEWITHALCREDDHWEYWHPHTADERAYAIRICQECPVKQACADYAAQRNTQWGIWGGVDVELETKRRQVKKRIARERAARERALNAMREVNTSVSPDISHS